MIAENVTIRSDIQRGALKLSNALDWDDEAGEHMTSHEDDEYRWAGVTDPKIVITTAHDPSSRLKMFAKVFPGVILVGFIVNLCTSYQEMKFIFPNSQRINRGNCNIKSLVEACRVNDVTDLIVLHETRGVPSTYELT